MFVGGIDAQVRLRDRTANSLLIDYRQARHSRKNSQLEHWSPGLGTQSACSKPWTYDSTTRKSRVFCPSVAGSSTVTTSFATFVFIRWCNSMADSVLPVA